MKRTRITTYPLALVAALTLAACDSAPPPESESPSKTASASQAQPTPEEQLAALLAEARLVDLSHPFDERTLYWPTAPSGFELRSLAHGDTEGGYFYTANAFSAPEHGGTHLDAPHHFARDGWDVAEIPVERLLGPAVVIDVRDRVGDDEDYRAQVADVERFEARHGRIPRGAIVLLRTGWAERWPQPAAYFGSDALEDASDLHFPSWGEAAARFLVQERSVSALGVDTASTDYGPSTDFPVHQVLGAYDVIGIENIANLDAMPPTGAWVIAAPMKIAGGSGAPLRLIGLVPGG